MITGNKGEWSEIYALFKLLGDGKVHAGDADMNKLPLYYPILNVIREECQRFEYKPDTRQNVVVCYSDGTEFIRLSMSRFIQESQRLLSDITSTKERAFKLPHTESFMEEIGCHKLKADSLDKSDIHIIIHDLRTNMTPLLGFSIKSQLGMPSTLLNAGKTTNFRFKVEGLFDENDASEINAVESHLSRIEEIYKKGYRLVFDDMENETFRSNLEFISDRLPELVAECLIEDSLSESDNKVKTAVQNVATRNPLKIRGNNVLNYYEHKMKQLLIDSALGMTPAKEWTGRYDANGGYLVVRKDGEIVCYHFYNRNDVEDYLYNNTRFERASRSRYGFGHIYRQGENSSFYLDLNLQIRFLK